ncbi:hypothetical protein ACLIIZ_09490 [Azonexus caeni]|jgi:hypothetical protein|uniref:hypothetical protein n=1 Tax=Azonexus caeni TaxID=266126 RepID=UPI003A874E56
MATALDEQQAANTLPAGAANPLRKFGTGVINFSTRQRTGHERLSPLLALSMGACGAPAR